MLDSGLLLQIFVSCIESIFLAICALFSWAAHADLLLLGRSCNMLNVQHALMLPCSAWRNAEAALNLYAGGYLMSWESHLLLSWRT